MKLLTVGDANMLMSAGSVSHIYILAWSDTLLAN